MFRLVFTATLATLALAAPAQASLSVKDARQRARTHIRSHESFTDMNVTPGTAQLRFQSCARKASTTVTCSFVRRGCLPRQGEVVPADCRLMTKRWRATVERLRNKSPRVARLGVRCSTQGKPFVPCADKNPAAPPLGQSGAQAPPKSPSSPFASFEQVSRTTVLAHPSYRSIYPADPGGDRLEFAGCTANADAFYSCVLYREVANPCLLQGPPSEDTVCAQAITYRIWEVEISGGANPMATIKGYADQSSAPDEVSLSKA